MYKYSDRYFSKNSFTLAPLRTKLRKGTVALSSPSSFTLVELLIVIGILAILTAAVVITLNPAELLKQGRDSTRMTDLASLSRAIQNLQTQSDTTFSSSTAQTLYISIPDTSSTCANLGLPTLPSGYSYHCVLTASSTRVDGTGWLPINLTASSVQSLSRLPLDPVNTTSTGLYYAYSANPTTQTFTLYVSNLESTKYQPTPASDGGVSSIAFEKGTNPSLMPLIFPYGEWIKVPGNGTFGTNDFYVMTYEAKCLQNNIPFNTVGASYDTGYHTYYDSSYPCTSANNKYIASTAQGFPIAYISHTTAKTYCTNIGAHLITNDEWMTIARNAEQQNSNWSTSVGNGYLYSGHNDNTPATALEASTADTDGYYQTGNSSGSQRRTLTLSNNQTIWDLAGNVYEHVQRSTNNSGDITTTIDLPPCSDGLAAWGWCQYGTSATYISTWTSDIVQNKVGPSNTSWNSSQGMGQVYTYKDGTDQGTTVFIRGAAWYHGSSAGAFALHLDWGTGITSSAGGFRCAR